MEPFVPNALAEHVVATRSKKADGKGFQASKPGAVETLLPGNQSVDLGSNAQWQSFLDQHSSGAPDEIQDLGSLVGAGSLDNYGQNFAELPPVDLTNPYGVDDPTATNPQLDAIQQLIAQYLGPKKIAELGQLGKPYFNVGPNRIDGAGHERRESA